MTSERQQPLRPSRDARRATLARLFSEAVEPLLAAGESYADLSVARLIRAVDVSRSTFYTYFDDKADLLEAMGEDVTLELAEAGAAWFQLASPGSMADVEAALEPLFTTYRRHDSLLRAITDAAAYDARIRQLHQALVERAVTGLREHLEVLQRGDSVAKGLDASDTARWVVWMLERGLHQMVGPAGESDADRLRSSLAELVWRALYARR